MPCTPAKARHLFKGGLARPKRNKFGLFYVQLCYEQQPENQPLAVGIDPGSSFEGFSVVGTRDTVLNLMVEAPTHVKEAVEGRRTMRRTRRYRKWRRPKRCDNRLNRKKRIPPSTRSRWEAKARIVKYLRAILPVTSAVVEDVQAGTRAGRNRKWNTAFSPVQVGKAHLYGLLRRMGLTLHLKERLHRRQLHRLQASKGGIRKPYGSTRSLGLKRGTLVRHAKYGLCTVGGFDRKRQTISLHGYRTNKRLTQGAKVKDCRICTWMAFRSWLVSLNSKKGGAAFPPAP